MVYFPTRKCYHAIKIAILLILVFTLLTLFEQWRGGKRSAVAVTSSSLLDLEEEEFEKQILADEARIIPGLGEGGVAAHLSGEDKRLGEESEKKLAMNVYLSDRIAYNRTLKDYRNPACARVVYDAELPSVSVILIFHNEPYSVVLRTIWSVLNSARRDQPWLSQANFVESGTGRIMNLGYPGQDPSSPFVYLKEIILVDDNSTLPELKGKLSHYVKTRLPPDLIRILRLPDRVGLTCARLAGARYAVGDVIVFLDAHCEVQQDWLRPLLQTIKERPHAVVVPIIDVINSSNFYYSVQNPVSFQVGGFSFTGHFTWIDVPEREKKRRGSDISPTWSPTMAGGLFAINRAYYWEIGAYDEQMAGWGGENLEMSFRIWQCGGTLETIPCSRVGHVFRSFHPYGLPAHTDTHGINTARMAEVWMDEYAELFYLHRPDLRNNPKIGDVTHRKVLREKLHCKSFEWYLDNIYKEKFVPVRDVYGYGRFMNPATGFCLDTMQREADLSPLGVYPCHPQLQTTQYLSLSSSGELRNEEDCAQVHFNRNQEAVGELGLGRKVLMSPCNKKHRNQKWKYIVQSGQLQQVESGLCLDAGFESGGDVSARPCTGAGAARQRWLIDYAQHDGFTPAAHPLDSDISSREARLQRLRGQRRISRSLLSYEEKPQNSSGLRRRTHKHKRHGNRTPDRHKNKFILKLVRTLMNNSEEHLEVDIHCRHRRLYPNNTFVRDLVTILNERNIKVINNGRVFERNRVTDLTAGSEPKAQSKLHVKPTSDDGQKTKMSHSKKRKHQESTPLPAVNVQSLTAEPDSQDKRIIIEDFVEVKPLLTTEKTKRRKKHKRKRVRATSPRTPPAPHSPALGVEHPALSLGPVGGDAVGEGEGEQSPLGLLAKQMVAQVQHYRVPGRVDHSMEDTAMLGSEGEGEGGQAVNDLEDWPVGESRFRSNGTRTQRRSPHSIHDEMDPEDEQFPLDQGVTQNRLVSSSETNHLPAADEGAGHPPPVKLVMRTNLTFNLDDNFFRSQAKSPDLAITSNVSRPAPPVAMLLQSDDSAADTRGETVEERGEYEENMVESSQDQSSSSSDSSDTS